MILLDTDVMIDLLRNYPTAVAWLDSLGDEEIVLPGYVVMELIQGCNSKADQEKLEKELGAFSTTWPPSEVCDEALAVFSRYYLSHSLGIIDALIGQLAVSLGLPLHTFNQRHYAAILNLRTVQPYAK